MSHEDVVKQLDNDLVGYDVQLGIGEYFTDLIRIGFRVEKSQYATGVAWLRDLLHNAEYDIERYVSVTLRPPSTPSDVCFLIFHGLLMDC